MDSDSDEGELPPLLGVQNLNIGSRSAAATANVALAPPVKSTPPVKPTRSVAADVKPSASTVAVAPQAEPAAEVITPSMTKKAGEKSAAREGPPPPRPKNSGLKKGFLGGGSSKGNRADAGH